MSEWLPILIMPKDGTIALVYICAKVRAWGNVRIAKFLNGKWRLYGQQNHKLTDQITHWLPIPAPPSQARTLAELDALHGIANPPEGKP